MVNQLQLMNFTKGFCFPGSGLPTALLILFSLLIGILVNGCAKSQKNDTAPHFTGVKTAPDNYPKTVTDGSPSLFALWKPVSGYTSFYDINGVLISVSRLAAPSLSQLQFLDSTNFKEVYYAGDTTKANYHLTTKDTTMYLNFVGDEELNTYGIDTLQTNRLAISNVAKFPRGNLFNIDGYYVTA